MQSWISFLLQLIIDHDQVEVRDREDCGSYTEGMSGTDSYEGQVN